MSIKLNSTCLIEPFGVICFVLLFHLFASPSVAQNSSIDRDIQIMEGVVIVKYKSAENRNWLLATASSPDSELFSFKLAKEAELVENFEETRSLVKINFDSKVDPRKLAKVIAKYPFVEYAEPKRIYPISETRSLVLDPNDPRYSDQSYLNRIGFNEAWDQVRSENGPVVIAIIDGGTDWQHEDLVANIWMNPNEIGGNGIDDDGNGFVDDIRGWNFANQSNDPSGLSIHPVNAAHGTETAGVAAASSDNSTGISGSSWNAKLMPINAGNDSSTDGLIKYGYEGILYAAKAGADIINCSWGGQGDPLMYEQEIIDIAIAEGALVVAAAGNVTGSGVSRNNDLAFNVPANYNGVLSVGSTSTNGDELASHSHFGVMVDVYAPGINLITTAPGNRYASATGTSFASPLAAGLAAMVKTAFPAFGPHEIAEQIRRTAVDMNPVNNGNFQNLLGAGRINPLGAVSERGSSLRITSLRTRDESGDNILLSGEKLFLDIDLEASTGDVSDAAISLSTYQDTPFVFSQSENITSLNQGSSTQLNFEVEIPSAVVLNDYLRLRLDHVIGGRSLSDVILVRTKPSNVFNHSNGVLSLGITNEGNIGYIDEDLSAGVGMAFYSDYILYEGGLLIGDSSSRVSDSVRGDDGSTQDEDFKAVSDSGISFERPGPVAYEETRVRFDDSGSSNPIGVSVVQESYLFNDLGRKNFAILRYTITNESSELLSGIRAGLFMDFDLNSRFIDHIGFSETDRTGIVRNEISDPTVVAGVTLLSDVGEDISYVSLSNSADLNTMSTAQKWSYLNNGIQQTEIENDDVALLISASARDLSPGESREIGYSIWVASSEEEAREVFLESQMVWNSGLFVSSIPDENDLIQPFPNPFTGTINLNYHVATQGLVELTIFDILGREVRSLVKSNRGIGEYEIRWDGKSSGGRIAPAGLYFAQLVIDGMEVGPVKSIHKIN